MDIQRLKHLRANLEHFQSDGMCVQRSLALVMDVPTAKLVIGTCEGRYIHAWVENRGTYFDCTKIEQDRGLLPRDIDTYLRDNQVTDMFIINRATVLEFAKRGKLSRWMLSPDPAVTHAFAPAIMGHVLLDELGIPYSVSPEGYLHPAK